jgi:hypothetical protein
MAIASRFSRPGRRSRGFGDASDLSDLTDYTVDPSSYDFTAAFPVVSDTVSQIPVTTTPALPAGSSGNIFTDLIAAMQGGTALTTQYYNDQAQINTSQAGAANAAAVANAAAQAQINKTLAPATAAAVTATASANAVMPLLIGGGLLLVVVMMMERGK